ncbi:MAG: DNRLRE domain-containing protein [Candidatus Sumerlaeia bacterium]|nr:DNRLRE domain-containing protein [Candidatus Sumerlaeia bacterium]
MAAHSLAVSLLSAALAAALPAGTVTISGATNVDDATLYENSPGGNAGAFPGFFAGLNGNGSPRRGVIRFDVSAIPPGSTVTGVTLSLEVDHLGGGTLADTHTVHRLFGPWTEGAGSGTGGNGGGGGTSSPGGVTWSARADGLRLWDSPGGDFVEAPSASAHVGTGLGSVAFTGPGLVEDVQLWLDHALGNGGWLIRGTEIEPGTARRYVSSEGNAATAPRLTVAYDEPAGPITLTGPEVTDDATLNNLDPTGNTGGDRLLRTGRTFEPSNRRALIRFDLSSIPASPSISAAELTLVVYRLIGDETELTLHRVTSDWVEGDGLGIGGSEGGQMGTVVEGAVTWNSRQHSGSPEADVPWTLEGGDFEPLPSAIVSQNGTGPVTFSGPGLAADLQAWIDGTGPNYGWMLLGDENTDGSARAIWSSDAPNEADRPVLTLTFGPAGASGFVYD